MFGAKLVLWLGIGVGLAYGSSYYLNDRVEERNSIAYRQLENDDSVPQKIRMDQWHRNAVYTGAMMGWGTLGVLFFWGDFSRRRLMLASLCIAMSAGATGCWKPFEPNDLQTIGPNEEGFLIPLTGDTQKQVSTSSEEFLQKNLVQAKQVRLPQQWVSRGYETFSYNGEWKPAGVLIKVDKAPVTREWTADEQSGTSNRKEAVWVMTADQVEFSTGWTCTARIASKDDAVKFLHNYPNGSLETVMDHEIRAMIQTTFGLEVTDLPMEQLRLKATPHIKTVVDKVTTFFQARGINITNLGISGGFVYKNKTIGEKLVEVFNAEQAKAIAAAGVAAQEETNKKIRMEAEGKAAALILSTTAEATGIKSVADAKAYEISKAAEKPELYLGLKRLELEKSKMEKWNGVFPTYFMGSGGNGPEMLLQVPAFTNDTK